MFKLIDYIRSLRTKDGNLTIKDGQTATIKRDVEFWNLTIEPGGTLCTQGFMVVVKNRYNQRFGSTIRTEELSLVEHIRQHH